MTTFNEHSPVWYAPDSGDVYAVGVGDTQIATGMTREHARRIVACVNACIGVPTALLAERDGLAAENARLRAEVAEWKHVGAAKRLPVD